MTTNKLIANSIASVRLITRSIDLNNEKDRDIFISFKNLSQFVFQNFEIPFSHIDYIQKNFTHRNTLILGSVENFIEVFGTDYNIELPLRAIEAMFLYADDEEKTKETLQLDELKFLIATLHHYVGVKYFELVNDAKISLN